MMKTLRLIGMALLAIVMSVSFIACSNDDDDNKEASTSLVGTTWKVTSVDNADENFNGWTNVTATFNENGTVTFNPNTGWNYTRWTLNDKTLKIVVGEDAADDYIEGTISINGKSATWNCYWADVDGNWTNKDKTHATVHLQKQQNRADMPWKITERLLYSFTIKRTEIRYYIVSSQWYFKTYPQLTIYKQEQKQGLLQNSPYLLREQLLTDC